MLPITRTSHGLSKSACCLYEEAGKKGCPTRGARFNQTLDIVFENENIAFLGHSLKHFEGFGIHCGLIENHKVLGEFTHQLNMLITNNKVNLCTSKLGTLLDIEITDLGASIDTVAPIIKNRNFKRYNPSDYSQGFYYNSMEGMMLTGEHLSFPNFFMLFEKIVTVENPQGLYVIYTIYPVIINKVNKDKYTGIKAYEEIEKNTTSYLSRQISETGEVMSVPNRTSFTQIIPRELDIEEKFEEFTDKSCPGIPVDGDNMVHVDISELQITKLNWVPSTNIEPLRRATLKNMVGSLVEYFEKPLLVSYRGKTYLSKAILFKCKDDERLFCVFKCLNHGDTMNVINNIDGILNVTVHTVSSNNFNNLFSSNPGDYIYLLTTVQVLSIHGNYQPPILSGSTFQMKNDLFTVLNEFKKEVQENMAKKSQKLKENIKRKREAAESLKEKESSHFESSTISSSPKRRATHYKKKWADMSSHIPEEFSHSESSAMLSSPKRHHKKNWASMSKRASLIQKSSTLSEMKESLNKNRSYGGRMSNKTRKLRKRS